MTASHDLERRIADFYATEPHLRAPDRVLGQALTSIESTPQRRVLVRVPWRLPPMSTFSKVAVATVAIVAVTAIAVIRFLPEGRIGVPPTPGPTATALPTPGATPARDEASVLPADNRLLDATRYYVDIPGSDVRAEFAVAEVGWHGNGWYLATRGGSGGGRSVSFWTAANVYPDACEESIDRLPDPPTGPTVEDLVAALDAQRHTDLQSVASPNVGGFPSRQIIMEPSTDLAQGCLNGENMQMWVGPGGAVGRSIDVQEPRGGRQDVMWIVDAGGHRVVIVGYYDSGSTEANGVQQIIESIEFVLP